MTTQEAEKGAGIATLLVVEDSAVQRVMLERLLRKSGYQVESAKDGALGLAAARLHQPALIISDISMPNMDGYEMCRAIKSDAALQNTPVLLLTGLDDPIEAIHGLEAGADNYLTKPVEDAHLLERIRSLLTLSDHDRGPGDTDGLQVSFAGKIHVINAGRRQTMNLLLSTYENAVRKNHELIQTQTALKLLTEHLEDEVKQRTRQLQIANRVKTEFIANISHEVRTPMNAIIGMTDLVLESALNDQQREMLSMSREAADKLLQLLNSLLDFSRMAEGTMEIRLEPFTLRQSVHAHVTPFLAEVEEKGLAFLCRVDAAAPDVLIGDFPHVMQILDQLLSNALKFTEQGHITLEVKSHHRTEDQVTLHFLVTDSGIGIAPDKQEWVFESFSQGDGSKTRKYGGTGLGLSLAKRLAEIMDCQLGFQSKEGQGSCFHVEATFPYDATSTQAHNEFGDGILLQTAPAAVDTAAQTTEAQTALAANGTLSPQAVVAECQRILQLCEEAIQTEQMAEVDRWAAPLKQAGQQLPGQAGTEFAKHILRMIMAARGSDKAKAMAFLEQAQAVLPDSW